MINKIDVNSKEFQTELENTKLFAKDVLSRYNLVFNPNDDVNSGILQGLTRNKLIYDKRYCPCFMVVEDDKENRICPCIPALNIEISNNGSCHCGIFCTKEKAKELENDLNTSSNIETQSYDGLSKDDCLKLLEQDEIDSNELIALLEARENKVVDFILVDVREWMEWVNARIKGVDYLVPTTSFYHSLEPLTSKKDDYIILYCHSGSRSSYCQRVMYQMGFKKVINLDYGIMYFQGDLEQGE